MVKVGSLNSAFFSAIIIWRAERCHPLSVFCKASNTNQNQGETKMSKSMKKAYSALRAKDMLDAIIPILSMMTFLMVGIALIAINTNVFARMAVGAIVCAVMYVVVRIIKAACNHRISSLGFSEVGLEQAALA